MKTKKQTEKITPELLPAVVCSVGSCENPLNSERYGFHNGGQVSSNITLSGCTNEDLLKEFMNRFTNGMYGNMINIMDEGLQYRIVDNSGRVSHVCK